VFILPQRRGDAEKEIWDMRIPFPNDQSFFAIRMNIPSGAGGAAESYIVSTGIDLASLRLCVNFFVPESAL
jgi:hypothetical protein